MVIVIIHPERERPVGACLVGSSERQIHGPIVVGIEVKANHVDHAFPLLVALVEVGLGRQNGATWLGREELAVFGNNSSLICYAQTGNRIGLICLIEVLAKVGEFVRRG